MCYSISYSFFLSAHSEHAKRLFWTRLCFRVIIGRSLVVGPSQFFSTIIIIGIYIMCLVWRDTKPYITHYTELCESNPGQFVLSRELFRVDVLILFMARSRSRQLALFLISDPIESQNANRQETRNAQQKNSLDDEVLTTHLKNYLAALCAKFCVCHKNIHHDILRTKASPD